MSPCTKSFGNHEQTPSVEAQVKKDVMAVVSDFRQRVAHFLHTKAVMESEVFPIEERLIDRSKPVTDSMMNLSLLSTSGKKSISKERAQIYVLKNDCTLFSQLYIAVMPMATSTCSKG